MSAQPDPDHDEVDHDKIDGCGCGRPAPDKPTQDAELPPATGGVDGDSE